MTALTHARQASHERWTHHLFPLAATFKAYKGGRAVIELATGKVRPGAPGQGLIHIGKFDEEIDATSVEKLVNVNLETEIEVERLENDPASPVLLSQRGQLCYLLDDQTVSASSAGLPVAGRVWDVDPVKGVLVQKLTQELGGATSVGKAPAYVSNDLIIPAGPLLDQMYDIPTTTGASTVTLPAAAKDGTRLYFVADGEKNGHTVQYRDSAAVNLTTALTALKRHLVIAVALGGKWSADSYVSP